MRTRAGLLLCFLAFLMVAAWGGERWGGNQNVTNWDYVLPIMDNTFKAGVGDHQCISWENPANAQTCGNHYTQRAVPVGHQLRIRSFSVVMRSAMSDADEECDLVLETGDKGSISVVVNTVAAIEVGPESSPSVISTGETGEVKLDHLLDEGDWWQVYGRSGTGGNRDDCTGMNSLTAAIVGTLSKK